MSATRYRVILSILGLLLALLAVGAVILAPSGDVTVLPAAIERYSPTDGAIVQRQTALEVQLAPGYELTMTIDGVAIPLSEMDITEQTGRHVFRPEPWKSIPEWVPGFHVVEVTYDRTSGLPDPGSLRWSFRTQ